MGERMRISWRLALATLQVLRLNTDLLIFPIVGLIVVSVVIALMMGGVLALVDFQVGTLMETPVWVQLAATFVLYLVGYFIIFSANTAMVGTAMLLMDGEQATFADGWRIAYTHRRSIFAYALLMATIGLLLRLFARWIGQAGRFVVPVVQRVAIFSVLNLAWHVVPVIVIPVLIAEELDPLAAIRRSSQLVTQRWGEGVVQKANVWLIFFLPMVLTLVVGIAAVGWVGRSLQEAWITTSLYVVVMSVVMMFLMATGLNDIYSAVIYRYAAAKPVPSPFESELLSKTFQARPSRILHFLRRGWGRLVKRLPVSHPQTAVPRGELLASAQVANGVLQPAEMQEFRLQEEMPGQDQTEAGQTLPPSQEDKA